MIPVCNRTTFLRQTIDSVVSQGIPAGAMQICVVDNSTQPIDWAAFLAGWEGGRIEIVRQPQHVSICDNWNACIAHARGHLVHILHDDDFVLPGFYDALSKAADRFPEVGLVACRALFIDESGIVLGVTERLPSLEAAGRDVAPFYYRTPIQCPGVAVRRWFYESHGGFTPGISHCIDVEMWARVVGLAGGVVLPDVLSAYRFYPNNHSGAFARSADNLRDLKRRLDLFASRYPSFDREVATAALCRQAMDQLDYFRSKSDDEAVTCNLAFVRRHVPTTWRLRRRVLQLARRLFT